MVFTPIIPNSQLMILANKETKSLWDLELFIEPGEILIVTSIVIAAALLVIGVTITIMHIQERRQDKKSGP